MTSSNRWQGDWLLILGGGLSLVGLLMLTGFANHSSAVGMQDSFMNRGFAMFTALVLALFVYWIFPRIYKNYNLFGDLSLVLALVLVILTASTGDEIKGATRWLSFGGLSVQPSEFIKVMVVFSTGCYSALYQPWIGRFENGGSVEGWGWWVGLRMLFFVIVMVALGLQSLTLALILFGVVCTQLVFSGLPALEILKLAGLFLGLIVALIAVSFFFFPEAVNMSRIEEWFNLSNESDKAYQVKRALETGYSGWSGVGYGNGLQKYNIPEASKDFMFSVVREELGGLGASALLVCWGALICVILRIARQAEVAGSNPAAYICYGIGMLFFGQFLVNVGSNLGLLPVNGSMLPLVSHGGSSLVAAWCALAIVYRVHREYYNVSRQVG